MFIKKDFISHAGIQLKWKIDCDFLNEESIETLAFLISEKYSFDEVIGIPRGGLKFAKALEKYKGIYNDDKIYYPRLIVDDVFTTGKSMIEVLQPTDLGIVIFSRNPKMSQSLKIISMFDCNFG